MSWDGGGGRGGPVGWEEGSRGLLAAYLSIVAIFFFFETASVHCESTSALKKRKRRNINILISCAWQRARANIREDSAVLLSAGTLVPSDMKIQLFYN